MVFIDKFYNRKSYNDRIEETQKLKTKNYQRFIGKQTFSLNLQDSDQKLKYGQQNINS